MNIDVPTDDFLHLFHKVEALLVAKRGTMHENTEIKLDAKGLKLTMSKTVATIIELCKMNDYNHSINSLLLIHLNFVRNFGELLLHQKSQQGKLSFNDIFCAVLGPSKFFDTIISIRVTIPTSLFTVAETVAFYLCSLKSTTQLKYCFALLHERLDENPVLVLKVVEQFCMQCVAHPCAMFSEYFLLENGFLLEILRLKPGKENLVTAMLISYSVLSKVLSPKLCPKGREFLLENISLLIDQYETIPRNQLLSEKFWNFCNELIPHPCEAEVASSVAVLASERLLSAFLFTNDKTPVPQTQRSFGVLERAANDSWLSTKTGLCNLNLFLKCINWKLSSSVDSKDLDFIERNLTHWNKLLRQTLSITDTEDGFLSLANSTVRLFLDQDDELIIQLLLQLETYRLLKKWLPGKSTTEFGIANPHLLFHELLSNLAHDSSVLLDWLISNETIFLLYFLRYLKLANSTWPDLLSVCQEIDKKALENRPQARSSLKNVTITNLISTLTQLKGSILRLHNANLFPYSPGPLLKHLESLESKWKESVEC